MKIHTYSKIFSVLFLHLNVEAEHFWSKTTSQAL